jgi:hypothetical protein
VPSERSQALTFVCGTVRPASADLTAFVMPAICHSLPSIYSGSELAETCFQLLGEAQRHGRGVGRVVLILLCHDVYTYYYNESIRQITSL